MFDLTSIPDRLRSLFGFTPPVTEVPITLSPKPKSKLERFAEVYALNEVEKYGDYAAFCETLTTRVHGYRIDMDRATFLIDENDPKAGVGATLFFVNISPFDEGEDSFVAGAEPNWDDGGYLFRFDDQAEAMACYLDFIEQFADFSEP